jgi:hypothetical protein
MNSIKATDKMVDLQLQASVVGLTFEPSHPWINPSQAANTKRIHVIL